VEINDPTHLTGHVCVDGSLDEEKYQGFALSGHPETPGVRRTTGGETDIYQELDRDCV
jgi:hypothetical protein